MTCFALLAWEPADAQPKSISVGFTNMSEHSVIVQGYTVVNGVQRRGQPVPMKKKSGGGYDTNVPAGVRFYTVYDANQPSRILLKDFPVVVQNRDVMLKIIPSSTNPKTLILAPTEQP